MTASLPVSARLAWWGTAWLRGAVGPDDLLDAVLAGDVSHVVIGQDGGLIGALAAARGDRVVEVGLALPVEGDPCGLGGPRELNVAALEAGEAVVIATGPALVPRRVGRSVEWTAYPAERRQVPDVGEADRALRTAIPAAANELAALDVARWHPDLADDLSNLRHVQTPVAPPGTPARCIDLAARAVQVLGIVDLAQADDGAAVSASQLQHRDLALAPLAAAGRRALVAACSPEVWPPQ